MMNFCSVEQISSLGYIQSLTALCALTTPCALLPSTMADVGDILVSTLCGMQLKISKFLSVNNNMLVVTPSTTSKDNDDGTNLTGNMNDSVLAYLNASKHSDFLLWPGLNTESHGPSYDSFLVDYSQTLSKSGGGRTKLESNNVESQLKRKFLKLR